MEDQNNMFEVEDDNDEKMKKVIHDWYNKTYTSGLKTGAKYMAVGAASIMKEHLEKEKEPTLRDYKRCIKALSEFFEVQLKTQQNENKKETNS